MVVYWVLGLFYRSLIVEEKSARLVMLFWNNCLLTVNKLYVAQNHQINAPDYLFYKSRLENMHV